jgi:hypothetical protein
VTDNQGHDLSYKTFLDGILSENILIDTSQLSASRDTQKQRHACRSGLKYV